MAKRVGKTKEKLMATVTKTVGAVECGVCGKVHLISSKDFVAFYGNIMVGFDTEGAGIIGDNIDEGGKIVGSKICCLEERCLRKLLGPIAEILGGVPVETP